MVYRSGTQITQDDPIAYLPCKSVRMIGKRQVIYNEEHPSHLLYLVIQGRVEITRTAGNGFRTVTGIIHARGLFGESCLVEANPCREAAEATVDVIVMGWTREEVEERIQFEPRLGLALSRLLVSSGIELQERIAAMSLCKIPSRVMLALVQLANRLGTTTPDGFTRIPGISQASLAEYIGTRRETVTSEMNRLRRGGSVRYTRQYIDIEPQRILHDLRRFGMAPSTMISIEQPQPGSQCF